MNADLPVGFWAGWVASITVVSLLCLCWMVYSIYFSRDKHDASNETVWDENLREAHNPAPLWWFWLIFAMLIFSLVYLMLYPGLGSYRGILNWSQGNRLAESYVLDEKEFGQQRAQIASASIDALYADELAMSSAEGLFRKHCAACHGKDGAGQANLFPDLNDSEWQWGSAPAQIEQTIRLGRRATMPGWQAALGDAGVKSLTEFIVGLSDPSVMAQQSDVPHPGAATYAAFCVACHGPTGAGNVILGAPDLTNVHWLYGGSQEDVAASIGIGRSGIMPAFGERLDDTQIRLLVAWLMLKQHEGSPAASIAGNSQ